MLRLYIRRMNDINIEGELAIVSNILLSFFTIVFYVTVSKLGDTLIGKTYL